MKESLEVTTLVGWAKEFFPVPITLTDGHAIALPILHFNRF